MTRIYIAILAFLFPAFLSAQTKRLQERIIRKELSS